MAFRIITRKEWGARYGDGRWRRPLPAREAWLHHSVTIAPDLETPYGDDNRAIRTIERIGRDRFGEVYGFPYTFGITPVGRIYEGHDVRNTGAHTKGHNTVGIGIVFVGNYERMRPTDDQLDACAWLLRESEREGWLRDARLTGGHRDVSATACPGDHAYADIDTINRRARTGDIEEDDNMPSVKDFWHDRVIRRVRRSDGKKLDELMSAAEVLQDMRVDASEDRTSAYEWRNDTLRAILAAVTALGEASGVRLSDEQLSDLAGRILAGLPVQEMAALVRSKLGDELARDFLVALRDQLPAEKM